jgi:hypothetical protein
MTDQARHSKRQRGGQSVQSRGSPELVFVNFDPWARKLMQRGTVFRDSNVELRTRTPMAYVKPMRTEEVKEKVVCKYGKTRTLTRAWTQVDDKRLDAKNQAYDRQMKELKDDHGAQWSDMTGNISNKVLEATELEPTYRAVEDRVDPKGTIPHPQTTKTTKPNAKLTRTKPSQLSTTPNLLERRQPQNGRNARSRLQSQCEKGTTR